MILKYLWYLIKHKWYVMIECFKKCLIWRGLVHDMSKFLPDEFIPYMRWFYGKYGVKFNYNRGTIKQQILNVKINDDFDFAWLKHQHRNKHHYQYWYLLEDSGGIKLLEMPEKYRIEMLCDWIGAGMAIHGKNDIREWYDKTKDWKKINHVTKMKIEKDVI